MSTKTGLDIRGVLREMGDNGMVLAAPAVAGTGPGPNGVQVIVWRPLAGEVVIPLSNVDYYQRALPVELVGSLLEVES